MILLKQRLADAGIQAIQLADTLSYSRTAVCQALNQGKLPKRRDFKGDVETYLQQKGLDVEGIWAEAATSTQIKTRQTSDNQTDSNINLETVMLSQKARKHFNLFRNPFLDDVRTVSDVFMNDDIRYVLASMRDAARHQGLLAVIGDSGAGKTVIRRMLMEELKKEGDTTVIFPRIFDKTRTTAAGLCDAIIADISSEKTKRSLEAKARQVERLLRMASHSGQRHVLIIEEAHDLSIPTMKYLKRFWEMEDGFDKLLGIIMIGQSELKDKLDERRHFELRELTRRCITVELNSLGGDLSGYLKHKFKCAGGNIDRVLDKGASDALLGRLTRKTLNGEPFCMAHPLAVHNLLARAMNAAAELGEQQVTDDMIKEV